MYLINLKASSGTGEVEQVNTGISVYPNPSASHISIDFSLSVAEEGKLLIYNMNGQIVAKLKEGIFTQGQHSYSWNGSQDGANRVPGTYICRLVTDRQILAKRLIIQ
jgi:flagellar hook assembly protein FlgD